jgi:hypothetical protein
MLYQVTFTSIKATFLLQYRRSFPLPIVRRVCFFVLCFVVLWGVVAVIVSGFICVPLKRLWDPFTPGYCINELAFWYVSSVISLITDLIIFIIPLPLLRTLPIRRAQKAVLMVVFGLGFL